MELVDEWVMAPNFTLKADDGRQVSLKDYRGKTVVFYFYSKNGTPGCTTEALGFKEAVKEFEKKDVLILEVSKDSVESHQKFKEEYELPFTLLSDPKNGGSEVVWRLETEKSLW